MMVLYISKGENDSEVPIHFPAEPAEVRSAITALEHSSTASGPVEIRRVDCPVEILEQDIKRAGLNSAEDIQKLNALTERIDAMSQQEKHLFTAVLSCECPSNLDEVLSFAGDLNRYELLNGVTTDWYLGKWAVENRKLETDVPEAIQPFLDYSAVGREYAASHAGEFCSLGYLKNREAAPVQGQAPYVIRLTLTSSGRQYDLSLPAAEEQLEQAKRALDVEDFSQTGITAVKFSSPHLAGLLPLDAAAVEDVNTFALCLREMEQEDGELRKFCAVLEAEQPETFTEALNIAMDRNDYEQIPEDMDEYGKQVLRRAGADDEIIDTIDGYMNFARLGEDSMEEDGVRRTEFGLVRRLSEPFPPQREMGPQMMQEVLDL